MKTSPPPLPWPPSVVPLKGTTRGFHSLRLLTDLSFAARFWLIAFLVSQAVFAAYVLVPKSEQWVTTVDEEGITRSRLFKFRKAQFLHRQQARFATKAFLDRSPSGFDDGELLEIMFLSSALEKARADLDEQAEERTAKQLHQKAEIESVEILKASDAQVLVAVKGQLARAGFFQGRPFGDTVPFRLSLKMLRNPDMSLHSRFPLAVADYRYETP